MKYYYCFSSRSNLFVSEIEYAKKIGAYIFYDEDEDAFFDVNNKEINIKNFFLFPRCKIHSSKILIDSIIRHGGNSLIKLDDFDKTLNWPYYIETKRNNIILSGSEIISNPQLIIDIFKSDKLFFKTKNKNFSGIIEMADIIDKGSPLYMAIEKHDQDDFIVSDVVNIDSDENGLLEYRSFVIDGDIYNISRVDSNMPHIIPKEVVEKVKDIVIELRTTDFPKSYVIDMFIYTDLLGNKIIDVLECNPIVASVSYSYNTIFEKSSDLGHRGLRESIPLEKTYRNGDYFCVNVSKNGTPSIFHNFLGGFASDLKHFSLYNKNISNSLDVSSTKREVKVLLRERKQFCSSK